MNKKEQFLIDMGKRMANLRKGKNLSQEKLAEEAGVTAQMISNAERGVKALRPENLYKISTALDVSADYLLSGKASDSEMSLIMRKLSLMTPEQFQMTEEIIDRCLTLCNLNSDTWRKNNV
ncbi:MAG: helix-turn-helix transcriptional regulator [Clostridia bacterium]|nr:helix-turn-helix transcriptional regulator [Clostridia bacterium]